MLERLKFRIPSIGLAIFLLAICLLGLMGWGLANNSQTRPQVGAKAPNSQLIFLEGFKPADAPVPTDEEIHLADYQGKIVVLNFWASWCAECIAEIPELEAFYQNHKNQGVEVLGVAYNDIDLNSISLLQRSGVTYGNVIDQGNQLSKTYQIVKIPQTFVIGPDQTIAATFFGPVSEEQLEAVAESLR